MLDKLVCAFAAGALVFGAFTTPTDPATVRRETAAKTFKVDPGHSSVVFRVMHVGTAPFYGRFNKISGELTVDPENLDQSKIEIDIPVASIDTNSAGRDRHLKSDDFFNAAEFPTLSFKSTKIEQKGEGTFHITGDLSLHGKTKSIKVPAKYFGTNEIGGRMGTRTGWEATFTIDRTDFDMNYLAKEGAVGKDVQITIALEGTLEQ